MHGFPQTRMGWAGAALQLAERFSGVIPDLRGYGRARLLPPITNKAQINAGRSSRLDEKRGHVKVFEPGAAMMTSMTEPLAIVEGMQETTPRDRAKPRLKSVLTLGAGQNVHMDRAKRLGSM